MRHDKRTAKPLVVAASVLSLLILPGVALAQGHGDRPSGSSDAPSRSEPASHDGGSTSRTESSPSSAPLGEPERPSPSRATEPPVRHVSPPSSSGSGGSVISPRAGSGSGSGARTGDGPVVGRAIPREGPPPLPANPIYPGGYYPWGYGGIGFGAYYDGYWGPYDPWYGGYPSYGGGYTGGIRLKVKPRGASVYVDGYFVGIVDEFDGIFQKLPIEPGAFTIEIRADGYEPHVFDVRILPDRTTTYEAELTPIK